MNCASKKDQNEHSVGRLANRSQMLAGRIAFVIQLARTFLNVLYMYSTGDVFRRCIQPAIDNRAAVK